MKRFAFALALCLLPLLAFADDIPLEMKGKGVSTVKVDKVITISEDATLVSSFPFTVTAKSGGFGYTWNFPDGMTVTRKGNVLLVTNAVKGGPYTIGVEWSVVDFKGMKVDNFYGSTSFYVGDVPPGPGPPNPVDPTDALFPALKAAYLGEKDTAAKAVLASLYKMGISEVDNQATAGGLIKVLHDAAEAAPATKGKLLATRKVIATELNRLIMVTDASPLTPTLKQQYRDQFARYQKLLEALP